MNTEEARARLDVIIRDIDSFAGACLGSGTTNIDDAWQLLRSIQAQLQGIQNSPKNDGSVKISESRNTPYRIEVAWALEKIIGAIDAESPSEKVLMIQESIGFLEGAIWALKFKRG